MSDINEIKQAYEQGFSDWNNATILSLITTIESLQIREGKWATKERYLTGSVAKYADENEQFLKQIESQKEENIGMIGHIQKQDALIQSQKEEIEKLLAEWKKNEDIIKRKLEIKQDAVDETMTENQSLKAITELAVNRLKLQLQIAKVSGTVTNAISLENTLSEIERLKNGSTS